MAALRIFHMEIQMMVSMTTNNEEQEINLCNHSLQTQRVTKTVVWITAMPHEVWLSADEL